MIPPLNVCYFSLPVYSPDTPYNRLIPLTLTRLFGPADLDPSFLTRLFAPVYLGVSIWTRLFKPV